MHYPGGAGASKPRFGRRKTVLGTKANPDVSFKKNTTPSKGDVDRANAMYTTPDNQKRDMANACGMGATDQNAGPAPIKGPENPSLADPTVPHPAEPQNPGVEDNGDDYRMELQAALTLLKGE